jgi:hypothetical protein
VTVVRIGGPSALPQDGAERDEPLRVVAWACISGVTTRVGEVIPLEWVASPTGFYPIAVDRLLV